MLLRLFNSLRLRLTVVVIVCSDTSVFSDTASLDFNNIFNNMDCYVCAEIGIVNDLMGDGAFVLATGTL